MKWLIQAFVPQQCSCWCRGRSPTCFGHFSLRLSDNPRFPSLSIATVHRHGQDMLPWYEDGWGWWVRWRGLSTKVRHRLVTEEISPRYDNDMRVRRIRRAWDCSQFWVYSLQGYMSLVPFSCRWGWNDNTFDFQEISSTRRCVHELWTWTLNVNTNGRTLLNYLTSPSGNSKLTPIQAFTLTLGQGGAYISFGWIFLWS